MASGIIFAELHMLSGERQESSNLVGVAASPVLSLFKRRRGQLFTIVEPNLPDSGEICRHLIETIEDEYFRDSSRTVTSSLRQAVAAANERLRAENAKAPPERQLRVGLSCAAIRDGDAYIAQVAPANAFILHRGSVKRVLSSYSVTPDASGNGTTRASDALGARLEPQVNFGFSSLEEGDMVVLASGAYWKLIPDRYILDAAKHIDPEMTAEGLYGCYVAHARRPTTSLVVIRVSRLPARQSDGSRGDPSLPKPTSGPVESASESRPRNDSPRTGRRSPQPESDAARPGATDSGPQGRSRKGTPEPVQRSVEVKARDRLEPVGPPSIWERLGLKRGRASLYPPGPRLEPVGKPSVKLKECWPQARPDRSGSSSVVVKLVTMVVLAALFVLLGNMAVGAWTSWQLGDPDVLVNDARERRAQAAAAENQMATRTLLVESHELLTRALRAKDDDATRTMAVSVLGEIDRIDRTVRIGQVSTLIDFTPILQDKGEVTQLVLDGDNLYVLDEGLDRLFKYTLTPDGKGVQEPEKHHLVVKRGDRLDGAVVGDLLALSWMPAGQLRGSPALFTLESGRSVVTYDPKAGLSRIEISESQRWGSIQAISGFAGGLYLLDTKLKGVFYYPPTKNGYESQPYTIVDSRARSDLSKALDLALDGNLYLLEGGGTVARFTREGRPLDFVGELPDGPIKGARGLYASASTRSLYVLDGEGERIVQFSPEGRLQRQFKADEKSVSFDDLRDIYVDEASRKVYVLARKSLFVFEMPAT